MPVDREALEARRRARLIGVAIALAGIAGLVLIAEAGGNGGKSGGSRSGGRTPEAPCPTTEPPASAPSRYDNPPDLTLQEGLDYRAVVHTTCGDIAFDLLEGGAPEAVANFVFLAEEGYYDGLAWPRVERNFVIQTGDPNNRINVAREGPGYSLTQQPPAQSSEYVYGTVVMASTLGRDTYGSQFFIIVHQKRSGRKPPAGLKKEYTIFGRVDERSYETIENIAAIDTIPSNDPLKAVRPVVDVYITGIDIRT